MEKRLLVLNAIGFLSGLLSARGATGGINKVRAMFLGSVLGYALGGLCFVP